MERKTNEAWFAKLGKGDQVKMLVFCSNQNDIFETKIELGMET